MTATPATVLPFCCVPSAEILADPELVDLPLAHQAVVFRIMWAWWPQGSLPSDPVKVARRCQILLTERDGIAREVFLDLLDTFAPAKGNERQLPERFQKWRQRGVKGFVANQNRVRIMNERRGRKRRDEGHDVRRHEDHDEGSSRESSREPDVTNLSGGTPTEYTTTTPSDGVSPEGHAAAVVPNSNNNSNSVRREYTDADAAVREEFRAQLKAAS